MIQEDNVVYLEPEVYSFNPPSKNYKQEIVSKTVCIKQRLLFSPLRTSTRKISEEPFILLQKSFSLPLEDPEPYDISDVSYLNLCEDENK